MKGLTTIAALPSGAGCKSAMPAEVSTVEIPLGVLASILLMAMGFDPASLKPKADQYADRFPYDERN